MAKHKAHKHDTPHKKWGRRFRLALPFLVMAFFLIWRAFLTPDILFAILFLVFLSYGLAFQFLKLFSPFIGLLLSYDMLRGLVPFVSHRVHFYEMINFDYWLGRGQLPTVWLQQRMYHGYLQWYDFYFYGLYMMHFVVPVLTGVLIWRTRAKVYWQYVWSLVTLSYAGFITYMIFPAAPPWMAAERGMIPPIEKLSTDIWWAFGVHNFPTIYEKFSPNLVAAVPSLHAAYPTLVALFVWRLFGWRWGLVSFIYPASVWLGIVYMGEHYIFDAIVGLAYAGIVFYVTPKMMKFWHGLRGKFRSRRELKATA